MILSKIIINRLTLTTFIWVHFSCFSKSKSRKFCCINLTFCNEIALGWQYANCFKGQLAEQSATYWFLVIIHKNT